MEESWNVETGDGHKIYGLLNRSGEGARSAVFIVHGLTGHVNEYQIKRAAEFLCAGHDVYRFNLYGSPPDARNLIDCTLETHAADLNIVVAHYGPRYERIFLIGHSFGGPTIMLAKTPGVTAASLWDPTFDIKRIHNKYAAMYDHREEFIILQWGVASLMGKPMYNHAETLDEAACLELARDYPAPVQVILAADGLFVTDSHSYHVGGRNRSRRDVVAGSTHCFTEGDSCAALLEVTAKWFDEFTTRIVG